MAAFEQKYGMGTNDGVHLVLWGISAMLNDI